LGGGKNAWWSRPRDTVRHLPCRSGTARQEKIRYADSGLPGQEAQRPERFLLRSPHPRYGRPPLIYGSYPFIVWTVSDRNSPLILPKAIGAQAGDRMLGQGLVAIHVASGLRVLNSTAPPRLRWQGFPCEPESANGKQQEEHHRESTMHERPP